MNLNSLRRATALSLTCVMSMLLVSPTLASSRSEDTYKQSIIRTRDTVRIKQTVLDSVRNHDVRDDYSRDDLEQMRSAMLELLDANQELAAIFTPQAAGNSKADTRGKNKEDSYESLRNQIQGMSDKDLTTLRKVLNPSKMRNKLSAARATLAESRNGSTANTVGLPGIDSYCGADVATSAIIAADAVYFVAEGVRDIAQDGCNEVLVVLGEGGNARALCLITDAVYLTAKAVNQAIHFCDDDYSASVGKANYDRLGHIHDDLAASVTNDNTNYANIINDAATNRTAIINNATTNKDTIVTNDNTNKTTIVTNDNANAVALTTLVNTALTSIINNANANKDEIKNLLLRTQIEADLAAADNATPVALFETPSTTCTVNSIPNPATQCGYLDLVRAIVNETIANVAGPSAASAQLLLAQGDAQKAAGQFKAAYTTYRKAYKTAAK
jgi:hypothetical protein